MPANRTHDRHARRDQFVGEVAALGDAMVDVVVIDRLDDAARHRLHVAPGKAAVGRHAFVQHHQLAGALVELVVVHAQEAADVDQAILLAAHRAAIGVAHHFLEDGGDADLGVALFALLDEVGVLDAARRVVHHLDAMPGTQRFDRAHVGHAHRLAAGEVNRHREADVGNARGADLVDQTLQFLQIDVALER